MGALAYNLLHMLRQFYVMGEGVRRSVEWLIRRLIKAGARVSYHARKWHVHVASAFPLAITTELCSAMADAGLQAVLSQEEKGSLRPEMGKTASWHVFLPEEVSHMAVPAKLDELHLRNTTELWADDAESRNGRRLPHNSG